jgi:xanthine dehydrogenase accessory factor
MQNARMATTLALDDPLARLAHDDGILVKVAETRGSTPRETGAWMVVWKDAFAGTIGGGNLEYQALAAARAMLAGRADAPAQNEIRDYALGPSLGQCCGGMVYLSYRKVTAHDQATLQALSEGQLAPVALFGNGHVGQALVRVLARLPFAVHWVDSRDDEFPRGTSAHVHADYSDPMHAAVADLAPDSQILIMSFSHWEDLDIVQACLERIRERHDLPFIGLIGSQTKWAMFRHRLQARGFSDKEIAQVTCPIGIPGIYSKKPDVIAVAVAAQLLQNTQPAPLADDPGTRKTERASAER